MTPLSVFSLLQELSLIFFLYLINHEQFQPCAMYKKPTLSILDLDQCEKPTLSILNLV